MPVPEGQKCANCRFFITGTSLPRDEGECRRYPPEERTMFKSYGTRTFSVVVSTVVSGWYWCGEWRSLAGVDTVVGIEAKPEKPTERKG